MPIMILSFHSWNKFNISFAFASYVTLQNDQLHSSGDQFNPTPVYLVSGFIRFHCVL